VHNRKSADKKTPSASQISTDFLAQTMTLLAIIWAMLWRLLRLMNIISAPKQLASLPKTKLNSDSPRTPPHKNKPLLAAKTVHASSANTNQVGAVLPSFSLLKYETAAKIAKEAQLRALLALADDSKKKSPCANK